MPIGGIIRIAGYLRREEVSSLFHAISFILTVAAGVVTHLIGKWLDGKKE